MRLQMVRFVSAYVVECDHYETQRISTNRRSSDPKTHARHIQNDPTRTSQEHGRSDVDKILRIVAGGTRQVVLSSSTLVPREIFAQWLLVSMD